MGGKNKQRTKGNVRPSSSGRAADVLVRERGVVPGFIGFDTSSNDLGYVPAVHGAEEIDSLVDADFRMVLRKLSKRDAVTKLKAVQEFTAMCKNRDSETVKGVLPYWPRIYCKVSLDHDRRVREASGQALEQLAIKVGRSLAPFLKSIMGHWLLSQCDTYAPAASAANVAFQSAFPGSKQAGAIAFCKEEILTILQDNLLKETADTLSDSQTVPGDEREAKYLRVVTCSLLALKKLLTLLSKSDADEMEEKLMHIISQSKFWKYSKHKSAQIRGAFFEAVASFCQYTPNLLKTEAARACSCVLLSIDDTDPLVCPSLWEAVLYIIMKVQDCWQYINAKKGLLPKLWQLLKEGGRGMAVVIHPHLLPFISRFPEEVLEPKVAFYNTFFTSVINGLSSDRAVSSSSETSAIIFSIVECLQFVLLQNAGVEDHHQNIQHMLINDQLLPLMETALKNPRLQGSPLFCQITHMVVSWEKRSSIQTNDETNETFLSFMSDFWLGIAQLCIKYVDNKHADENVLQGISLLLQILKNPDTEGKRLKNVNIKFSDFEDKAEKSCNYDSLSSETKELNKCTDTSNMSALEQNTLTGKHLEDLVCELATLNMIYINQQNSEKHLKFLSVILSSFPSFRLFQELLDSENEKQQIYLDDTCDLASVLAENPAVQFLMKKLIIWLKKDTGNNTDFLVDMLYSILHCCNRRDETKLILDHITKMELRCSILVQIVQKANEDSSKFDAVSNWLKGEVLGENILKLTDELLTLGLKEPNILKSDCSLLIGLVISQQVHNDTLIDKIYVEKIIFKLNGVLSGAKNLPDSSSSEPVLCFICDIVSSFFKVVGDYTLLLSAEGILLTVFQLWAQRHKNTHSTDYFLQKLYFAFITGVQSLVGKAVELQEINFIHDCALWVKNELLDASFSVKSLQVLVSAVCCLVENVIKINPSSTLLLQMFLDDVTPDDSQWQMIREQLSLEWLRKPLTNGWLYISCKYHSLDQCTFHSSVSIPTHLCYTALLTQTLLIILDSEDLNDKDKLDFVKAGNTVAEMLYSLQWCDELEVLPSAISEYCSMLKEMKITYDRIIKEAVKLFPVLDILYFRSLNFGSLWSMTFGKYLETHGVTGNDMNKLYGSIDRYFPVTAETLCTIQGLSPVLPEKDKDLLIKYCIAEILNVESKDIMNIHGGCGHLAIIRYCLNGDASGDQELQSVILHIITEWRETNEHLFLFNTSLKDCSHELLIFNSEIMCHLSWLIRQKPCFLTESQWDFILCSMMAWLETLSESQPIVWSPWIQLFACETCNFVIVLSEFFKTNSPGLLENLPENLIIEWNEFFMKGVHSLLLPLLVKITDEFLEPGDPMFPTPVLKALGGALSYISIDHLCQNNLHPKFVTGQKANLPDKLQTLLNTLVPLLSYQARPVQLTVYNILLKVMPELSEFDKESIRCEDDEEEMFLSPPAALTSYLSTTEEFLDNFMEGVQVGEFVPVLSSSDEYYYVLGYLLSWKLIISFFKASCSQLRVLYSYHLKKSKCLNRLLCHLFRLMPVNPSYSEQSTESCHMDSKTFFTESQILNMFETNFLSSDIPHLSCSVYYGTLKYLPAMVRLWFNSLEKRLFTTVDRFTSKFVSNILSSQEISSVQNNTKIFDNMMVKARPTTREVIATYSVDDIFIELVIKLPTNYPLGVISVESGKRVGVAVQQWRNWMLQLTTFLTHQNGSIMEGLTLWKNNVDKRFEGVEDCMICYSVIHGSNYSLPKKSCRTCRKKFHSACLYKWFTSSNKSACPLCRENFF
ncbi:E3 ubiquitin-protein ligase listerin [Erpetoichthys calabaricus]|uniref:E3 ubiquitin-protein ligase listerin n=1 Tax=Erpetoichthys calabaricus TaxID=27687 RepID=UPI0022344372|nr:E3 ubiquitin-protein ligase listerin [Erpetoichthys calabaricus]